MFNTNDLVILASKYTIDSEMKLAFGALAYYISKVIREPTVVFKGKINQIILIGGLGFKDTLTSIIQSYVEWIAPVTIYPGEKEADGLVTRTSSVLDG